MDKVISQEIDNGNISILKKNKVNPQHRLSKKYSELLKKKGKKKHKKLNKKITKNKKIIITPSVVNPIFIKTKPKKRSSKRSLKKSTQTSINKEKQPEKKQPEKKQPEKKQPEKKQPEKKQPGKKQPGKKQPGKKQSEQTIKKMEGLKKPLKNRKNKSKRFSKKKLHKKHTNSRRISFTCYTQNDRDINDIVKKANQMSNEEIREKLLNDGIEIKSNKNKLLKDIYMFSSLGGIKINKE